MRKAQRAHEGLQRWWALNRQAPLFVSVLVLAELRQGLEKKRARDPVQAQNLHNWLNELRSRFGERIIPVDERVADVYGQLQAGPTLPVMDALMAATALAYDLVMVTRNQRDFAGTPVKMVNPFNPGQS